MRDFLFRGKGIHSGKLVQGYYVYYPDGICDDGNPEHAIIDTEKSFIYSVYPETICQYTGLTDKNGREIFEGGIVRLPKCENDIAVFLLRGCNYFLKGKRSNYVLESYESECFEVIGNIFDNPELLSTNEKLAERDEV